MKKILHKAAQCKKKLAISFSALVIVLLGGTLRISAMTNDEIANFLCKNSAFLQQNSIIYDVFRWLGWMIIKGLKWMADGCQTLYSKTFGLADFTSYSAVTEWISTIEVVCIAILVLSVVMYGIILMIHPEKRNNILVSVILFGICVSTLAEITITVNKAVSAFCQDVIGDTMSDDVINSNFYDLLYIDQQYGLASLDENDKEYLAKCHYSNESFDFDSVDINEVINYKNSNLSEDAGNILKKSVTFYADYTPGGSTGYDISDVYNGFGWNSGDDADFMNEFYYRYHTNGFQMIVPLIAICIVFICVSYKTAKMFFEIPLKKIYALFNAHDITGEQKTLKILGSIKDSYIIIMIGAIDTKLFQFAQQFLAERYDGFTYVMLLIFIALAVMDGPNIVQTITGEDAGLNNVFGKLIGMTNFARGLGQEINQRRMARSMRKMRKSNTGNNTNKSNVREASKTGANDDIKGAMDKNGNNQFNGNEDKKMNKAQENEQNSAADENNPDQPNNPDIPENEKPASPETEDAGDASPVPDSLEDSPLNGFDPDDNQENQQITNEDMAQALAEEEDKIKYENESSPKSSYKGRPGFNGTDNVEETQKGSTPESMPGTPEENAPGGMPRSTPEENVSGSMPRSTPEGNAPGGMPRSTPEGNAPGGMPRSTPEGNAPGGMPRSTPEGNAPGGMPRSTPEGNAPGGMPRSTPEGNAPRSMPRSTPEGNAPGGMPRSTPEENAPESMPRNELEENK